MIHLCLLPVTEPAPTMPITFFIQKKRYQYIEIVEESKLYGSSIVIERPIKIIRARREAIAYIAAYKNFRTALKMHEDLYYTLGWLYIKPIGFKLLNQAGEDIAATIDFANKEAQEKAVDRKIYRESAHTPNI